MKPKPFFISFVIFIFFVQIILVSTSAAVTRITRIMPLGDSITYDHYSGDIRPEEERIAYRYRLWQLLNDEDYDFDFVGSQYAGSDIFPDAENEGHPGWHADGNPDPGDENIVSHVYDWLVACDPVDVVLLHIGTNDVSDPQTVAEIVLEVEEILDEIFAYSTEITVILAKIINRKSFSQKTNDFNNLLPGMVNTHDNKDKVIIVDMEVGAGINYGMDMIDNLHPNENGYSKMANVWFDALEQILPVADFTADPTSAPIPLTVSFTDESTGEITDFTWDFGDGSGSSTQQNPSYTYNDPGTYTVSLTATGPAGTDTETKTDYITVNNSTDGDGDGDGGGGGGGGGCFISTATHGL